MGHEDKSFLNLAGEFAVASELNRRGIHAAVTYGTSKRADVFAMSDTSEKLVRIEVKCSDKRKWLIGERGSKAPVAGDFRVRWVLVFVPPITSASPGSDEERGKVAPRFFILTPEELHQVYLRGADIYDKAYRARHGKSFSGRGVPNVSIAEVEKFEGKWESITKALSP